MKLRELSREEAVLSDMGVRDLVDQIIELLARNAKLEADLAAALAELARCRPAMCGALYNTMGMSCQLSQRHDGLHAWRSVDEILLVRW